MLLLPDWISIASFFYSRLQHRQAEIINSGNIDGNDDDDEEEDEASSHPAPGKHKFRHGRLGCRGGRERSAVELDSKITTTTTKSRKANLHQSLPRFLALSLSFSLNRFSLFTLSCFLANNAQCDVLVPSYRNGSLLHKQGAQYNGTHNPQCCWCCGDNNNNIDTTKLREQVHYLLMLTSGLK